MLDFIEKLAARIPGYLGYAELELRRESDQAVRRAVANRLADCRAALSRLAAGASRAMQFEELERLEGPQRRLERLADTVRLAPAGYAGPFSSAPVDARKLQELANCDARMLDAAEILRTEVAAWASSGGAAPASLEQILDDFERALLARDEFLKGVA